MRYRATTRIFPCHSRRTLEGHVMRLLGKLEGSNRREAAAVAARLGLDGYTSNQHAWSIPGGIP